MKQKAEPPAAQKKMECPVVSPLMHHDTPTGNAEPAKNADFKEVMKEVVLWEQPWLSGKVFLFLSWLFYATCPTGEAPVNVLCYFLILRLVSVAGPRYVAGKLQESENGLAKTVAKLFMKSAEYIEDFFRFPSEKQVSFCVKGFADYAEEYTCKGVSALRQSDNDISMLKIALAHLVVLMVLTSLFSIWNLFFLAAFIAMTVPAIYSRHRDRIDPLLQKGRATVEPHLMKVKSKGEEVYGKVQMKIGEATTKVIDKYNERFGKKEMKTE